MDDPCNKCTTENMKIATLIELYGLVVGTVTLCIDHCNLAKGRIG